jgi:hypothetical protein
MSLLPHKRNLETKINGNYKREGKFFDVFMKQNYILWNKKNMKLTGMEKKDIFTRVDWFTEYLDKIDFINLKGRPQGKQKNWITPQSKLRPSVLEEFVYYLLKDIPLIDDLRLKFTNKKVFAGLSISPEGNILIKEKDVDVALVKEEKASVGVNPVSVAVPAVAIEVKTYLDKTMWSEAQFTAQLIKRGNPACSVYVVAETNAVAIEELLPESPVNEIFIIRRNSESEVDKNTVYDFFCEVKDALSKIQETIVRQPPGRLLHPRC